MFVAMARKAGVTLTAEDIPDVPLAGKLSGADIEGIVVRATRRSRVKGEPRLTKAGLEQELAGFLPSIEGLEKEMQEVAAMLECTDAEFLPARLRAIVQASGGRERLQHRFIELRNQLR
ncbi:MAG: hypothetical protein WDO18_02565 [Acidobacteriota bacterium]